MTNGCGDEKIRLVVDVVNGRRVVVENADVVYDGAFIVVDVDDLSEGCDVVEMLGIDGDFVVNFGMNVEVVVVPVESPEKKFNLRFFFKIFITLNKYLLCKSLELV